MQFSCICPIIVHFSGFAGPRQESPGTVRDHQRRTSSAVLCGSDHRGGRTPAEITRRSGRSGGGSAHRRELIGSRSGGARLRAGGSHHPEQGGKRSGQTSSSGRISAGMSSGSGRTKRKPPGEIAPRSRTQSESRRRSEPLRRSSAAGRNKAAHPRRGGRPKK